MDTKQRIAIQRGLAQEALGKLRAASELFGAEDDSHISDAADLRKWNEKVEEFENWVFCSSPIA